MKALDIVRHRETGATGVILATISLLREDGPWSVMFDGTNVACAIGGEEDEYEVIGRYDPVPDADGCGMGKGAQCCRFLGLSGKELMCLRFGDLHWGLVFKSNSGAVRDPAGNYPDCKLKS
jgi:hypothetical protein